MATYPLEPTPAETTAMGRAAVDLLTDFVERLPTAPASTPADIEQLAADLLRPPPEGPGQYEPLLEQFRQAAAYGMETAGPGYLAFIPGGGLVTSALAELLAQGFNRFTGLTALAPALVALEESTLRWLCHEFGLPRTAAGLLTTGGSMATLTAVVAARHRLLGENIGGGTLYVTAHTHRCVAKAARIAGLPAAAVRTVPTDADLGMDPDRLTEMIAADRAAGRLPFLLVGTAGTTNTGAIDPLPALARVAGDNGMWFHVDAAYGGFFHMTERGRTRLRGIEQADSVVLDPHKGLFLPYGTGALLVRDRISLLSAFAADGHYLQDADGDVALPDYADLGPELAREFRGLRLWLPLQLHGVAAFRAALDEKLDLAEQAHRDLATDGRLELPWEPQLSVVAFRCRDRDDQANEALMERVNASRRVLLSSTRIHDRHVIRLCVLSHRTHAEHIAEAVEIIQASLSASG